MGDITIGSGRGKKKKNVISPERFRRLWKLEKLLWTGITNQAALARKFGVSNVQIHRDIKLIKEQWAQEDSQNRAQKKRLRISQLERIAAISFAAFERSKGNDKERTITRKNEGCNACQGLGELANGNKCRACEGQGVITSEVVTERTRDHVADPSWLQLAKACFVEAAKIEGLQEKTTTTKVEGAVLHAKLDQEAEGSEWLNADPQAVIEAKAALARLNQSALQNKAQVLEGVVVDPVENSK